MLNLPFFSVNPSRASLCLRAPVPPYSVCARCREHNEAGFEKPSRRRRAIEAGGDGRRGVNVESGRGPAGCLIPPRATLCRRRPTWRSLSCDAVRTLMSVACAGRAGAAHAESARLCSDPPTLARARPSSLHRRLGSSSAPVRPRVTDEGSMAGPTPNRSPRVEMDTRGTAGTNSQRQRQGHGSCVRQRLGIRVKADTTNLHRHADRFDAEFLIIEDDSVCLVAARPVGTAIKSTHSPVVR